MTKRSAKKADFDQIRGFLQREAAKGTPAGEAISKVWTELPDVANRIVEGKLDA